MSEVTLRVMVVDDHAMVRSGFSMVLSVEPDLVVVGDASDGAEAVRRAVTLEPDVILMDVQMPGMDGIAATRVITAETDARVVIVTTFDRDDYLFDALEAGASGFVLKNAEPEQLVDAVRAAGHGHALLAPEVTRRVIQRMRTPDAPAPSVVEPPEIADLTAREREVLILVAEGLSNAEIAKALVVGESTVKTHVSNCLAKLRLRDRVQAVAFAYRVGLMNGAPDPPSGGA
ncbi:MAG: response regulator transcription factor [Thermoleophilia bacterium]